MRLSYDWLSDFVDLSGLTAEEVAEKLTMRAFEVEEIKRVGADLQGEIVVGEIMEIAAHPDPKVTQMRVTKTRIKDGGTAEVIVCGANNIQVGQRIPVALPGSVVVDRKTGGKFAIGRTDKRGVVSNGMLCSPGELGTIGGEDGILILDPQTPVGTDVKELLGLKPDAVLIVEPRSNRGDALCVRGMAREVAALFHRPPKGAVCELPSAQGSEQIGVSAENSEDCPFFTIRLLKDVKIGQSPAWMVSRLEAVGMRSVNNVVDITNYVMHEYGQPLHAYDIRQVRGGQISCRRAKANEKLITLDGRERQLTDEVLVIADGEGVIGIAGVMGGQGSEIADDTTSLALEAADFNARSVRRSSRLLGLSSESSLRFERGVDISSVRLASDRAAQLMIELCGAKLGTLSTTGGDTFKPADVTLTMAELKRLIEINVSTEEAEKLLTPLGFGVKTRDAQKITVQVPSFRSKDVTREIDLVEEVTRLYGYDNVPVSMPKSTVAPPLPDTTINTIADCLSACGLNEAWISSLVSADDLSARGSFSADHTSAVAVLNPLSDEHQVLRQSLLPGLLKAVAYNQDRGTADVWLFETGLTYSRQLSGATNRSDTATSETLHVGGVIAGDQSLSHWLDGSAADSADGRSEKAFFRLKGVVENLLERLSVPSSKVEFIPADPPPAWFHPLRCAQVLFRNSARDKEALTLGCLGETHPQVAEAYGLKVSSCLFELDVEALKAAKSPRRFLEYATTPVVIRDLTADLPGTTPHAAVKQVITQVGGELLRKVELVSIFKLSQEQMSLSYRLSFQHSQQTLTAEEIDKTMSKVRDQLSRRLSATFRA